MGDALKTFCEEMAKAKGVWVAFGLDHSQHWSTTVFTDELAARRYAMENYLTVGFMRYGEPLDKAEHAS